MTRFEDGDEAFYALRRGVGRFTISKRFPEGTLSPFAQRFAYEVRDSETEEVTFESADGWEVVLHETPTRQQLKALFYESSRGVTQIAFQRFGKSGNPIHRDQTLRLDHDAIQHLLGFLEKLRAAELVGADSVRFSTESASQLLSTGIPEQLLRDRASDVAAFLRSDIEAPEVVALARREARLKDFKELVDDDASETECQAWLESEPWVIGLGAAPQFLHRVGAKLEQVVRGPDIVNAGSRPDSLMKTAASLSALVLVEIKRPGANLLEKSSYRSGAWQVSKDVTGGVAQLHQAIDAARQVHGERLNLKDDEGFESELFAEICRPRSVLIVGTLGSLCNEQGKVHTEKFRSFESFRRSLSDPEVITFDELIHRAQATVRLIDRYDSPHEGQAAHANAEL